MKPGEELRDLAKQLHLLILEHPAGGMASTPLSSCADHISAIARCVEANVEIQELRNEGRKL